MVCVMTNMNRIIQYIDPTQFQVYGNREKNNNNIIKGLIEVINDIISIKELNPLAVLHTLINQSGDKEIEVKKQVHKINEERDIENKLCEQKEVGGKKIV